MHLLPIASFCNIHSLQGSVTTQLQCGGMINSHFIANCPESVTVKKNLKIDNYLMKIWK